VTALNPSTRSSGSRPRFPLRGVGRLPLLPLAAVATVLVAWTIGAAWLAGTGDRLAATKLPFPHAVLEAVVRNPGLFVEAILETARGALIGFGVGLTVGVVIGFVMARSRWLEDAAYPYLVAAQMIPTIALAPLIFSAVKDPGLTKVLVAGYISVFAVSLGTIRGLRSTPHDALDLMRTLNAGRRDVLVKLQIPAAVPFFFAGLRVAAPLAVIGEIVVELAGSKDGLGTLILTSLYYGSARAHTFWAAIILTLLTGLVFSQAVALIERRFASWQPDLQSR
jgi:NitT/TauT family transport system permease protein